MQGLETTEKDELKLEEEIKKKIKQATSANERVRLHLINENLLKKKQMDKELEKEIAKITKEMELKALPLQQEINQIVTGQRKISKEDLEKIEFLNEEEKNTVVQEGVKLDGYWHKVMMNCEEIARDIKKKDEAALNSLMKIEHHQEKDTKDFSVSFHFAENEYFESPCVLTKKFKMKNEQEGESSTCEPIKWKEGKNLTVKLSTKKQKNKKTGKTRNVTKEVPDESFFNFFMDTVAREEDDDDEEEDENEFLQLEDQIDMAQFFIDELIPYSLEYYFALRKGDDEEGLEEVEENEDDDDEDEEEEAEKKKKTKKVKKPRKKSGVSEKSDKEKKEQPAEKAEKPECKQQ